MKTNIIQFGGLHLWYDTGIEKLDRLLKVGQVGLFLVCYHHTDGAYQDKN